MALLETMNLVKRFGGLTATDDVDLRIAQGERVGLIGPNGAGKSTLINLITGLLEPSGGEILFNGEPITDLPPHEIVQRGITKSFQTASIFPELSVEENAQIAALAAEHGSFRLNFLRHLDDQTAVHERTAEALESVDLWEHAETPASELPYGDKRRLELAIALVGNPDLLLMDEPTAGMSPEETDATVELIEQVTDDLGLTFVLVEHDMEIVFDVSERIVVLNRGEIIADGPPSKIRGDERVQDAYLGGVEL